jgi:hypothetical protein
LNWVEENVSLRIKATMDKASRGKRSPHKLNEYGCTRIGAKESMNEEECGRKSLIQRDGKLGIDKRMST